MARAPRIQYPGAVYHLMSRGVKGEAIFKDRLDYELFLITLAEACERTGWRVHAYALLPNHWHGLVATPQGNLVDGMKWFQGAFAQRFNARHGQRGHVFQGRYKALIIQAEASGYFETVSTYIHLNPARANRIPDEQAGLETYAWSSYPFYLRPRRQRPKWLTVDRVLGNLGLKDDRRGRLLYCQHMNDRLWQWRKQRRKGELEQAWKAIRWGWCLGDDGFKEQLIKRLDGVVQHRDRASYSGEAVVEHDQEEAERLIRRGLLFLKLTEDQLGGLPKGDLRKCALACLAHRRTTVRHSWLAARLHMGCVSNMTFYMDRVRKSQDSTVLNMFRCLEQAVERKERDKDT